MTEQEQEQGTTIIEEKDFLQTPGQNEDSSDKNKDAYFIMIMPSEEKIDFKGLNYQTQNKIKPSIIYNKTREKENKTFI